MKKTANSSKGKAKKVTKPIQKKYSYTQIPVYFEKDNETELEIIETVRKLTGISVTSKAIKEALINYPNLVRNVDKLNAELRQTNRDYEQVKNKLDTINRAFNLVLSTDQKPKQQQEPEDWKQTIFSEPRKQLSITDCPECGADLENRNWCHECDWDADQEGGDDES